MNRVLFGLAVFVSIVAISFAGSAQVKTLIFEYSHNLSFGSESPISLPAYVVKAKSAEPVSEEVIRNLERLFAPRKQSSLTIVGESVEKEGFAHGLKESLAEFAMIGSKQIRELKGGVDVKWFSDTTTTLYLWKSGISWHPQHNRHVTYTFGPKMRWSYRYNTYDDLTREVFKRPIMFLSELIERPVDRMFHLDK